MHVPTVTANYLAILALIYAALALQVIRLRRSSGAPFNDGGNLANGVRISPWPFPPDDNDGGNIRVA